MLETVGSSGRPRVLLYSPIFLGHPVVYCRVYARMLLEQGCDVIIASHGTSAYDFSQWSEIGTPPGDRWTCVDLGGEISPKPGPMTAEDLVSMQRAHRADITLFIHADYFKEQFKRLYAGEAPRLLGRNVAIFSITAAWYPGEDNLTGEPITLRAPTLRTTLGNIARRVLSHRETDRYFFHKLLERGVVDVLAVKDERVAQRYGTAVRWMPEIFRVFGEAPTRDGESQFEKISSAYRAFLDNHRGQEVLLYFGNAAWYKGYDHALEIAAGDPECVFVHCGAPELGDGTYAIDVAKLKSQLRAEGRLFETGEFLIAQRLIEHFFDSASRIVSTHRLAGTSGTMLQAVECGKPILTPDRGLLAWRTKEFRLGETYRGEAAAARQEAWQNFKHRDPADFSAHLASFISRFSEGAVRDFTQRQVLGAMP